MFSQSQNSQDFSNIRIIPTQDELKILRDKLSNVKDLFIYNNNNNNQGKTYFNTIKSNSVPIINNKNSTSFFNNNQSDYFLMRSKQMSNPNFIQSMQFPEKELDLMNQRYYELQKFIEINKEKVEKIENYDQLLKENEDLKLELNKNKVLEGNSTFYEILKDYTNMKSQLLIIKNELEEKEKIIFDLERQNRILKEYDNNVLINVNNVNKNRNDLKSFILSLLINKNILDEENNLKIISDLFGNNYSNLEFLIDRIEQLELQNFHLITKIEKISQNSKNNLTELIEYSEVISDIKSVLNQVYESQSLTTEFLIIRETLNNRSHYLSSQKELFKEEIENIKRDSIFEKNLEIIQCKDKITETKLKNKILEVLDDKIEILDNFKNNIIQIEDMETNNDNENNNLAKELINENNLIKIKNLRMREFIYKIIKNKNKKLEIELTEKEMEEICEIMNTKSDILYQDDIFHMMKAQAILIENILIEN